MTASASECHVLRKTQHVRDMNLIQRTCQTQSKEHARKPLAYMHQECQNHKGQRLRNYSEVKETKET